MHCNGKVTRRKLRSGHRSLPSTAKPIPAASPPDPNGAVGPNHVVTMCQPPVSRFSIRRAIRSLVRPRITPFGLGLAAPARLKMPATRLFFTINWPIAGSSRSSPPPARLISTASPFRRPTIRPELIFGMPFRPETQFSGLSESGRLAGMPTISARASSLGPRAFAGVGAYALNRAQAVAGNPNPAGDLVSRAAKANLYGG